MPDRRRDERLAEGLASALKHFMEGGHPDAGTVERAFRAGWTARDHWGTANLFAQLALAASAEGASGKRWTICEVALDRAARWCASHKHLDPSCLRTVTPALTPAAKEAHHNCPHQYYNDCAEHGPFTPAPPEAEDEERCAEHVPAAGAGAYAICNMPRDHWRHAKIGGHTFVPQEKLCGYVFEGGNACGASKAFHDQAVAYLGGGKTFQFHAFVPQEKEKEAPTTRTARKREVHEQGANLRMHWPDQECSKPTDAFTVHEQLPDVRPVLMHRLPDTPIWGECTTESHAVRADDGWEHRLFLPLEGGVTSYAETWKASDMTLRDYFAAQALGAVLAGGASTEANADAELAYRIADAMLKEREETRHPYK